MMYLVLITNPLYVEAQPSLQALFNSMLFVQGLGLVTKEAIPRRYAVTHESHEKPICILTCLMSS
jgi:hypothetical protein